jgi:hypothetical protein
VVVFERDSSTGSVSSNDAVGKRSVSIPRSRSASSRRASSDTSVDRSASSFAAVIVSPSTSTEPVTPGVRPTASLTPMLANSSRTR